MPFDAANPAADVKHPEDKLRRWGASSETGRMTDVLLSAPAHLEMVPCNDVTRDSIARGLRTEPAVAERQHDRFAAALARAGVRCHFADPINGLPDLSFTRDSVLMSPWGLIELRPSAEHRRAETRHVAAVARRLGVPVQHRVGEGSVEGGDVCLVRDGVIVIGHSNERTNFTGAKSLGALFAARGWEVIHTRFDPRFLHLDTIMTMVADRVAVVCPEALDDVLLERLSDLDIDLVTASVEEVGQLGANLLSLGDGRVVAASGSGRIASLLASRGLEVIEVDIDQFTRCGGGPHCLTMPLARRAAG